MSTDDRPLEAQEPVRVRDRSTQEADTRLDGADLNRGQTGQELAAERRFQLVVEAVPNAMVMLNRAGEIVMINAQAERVFGYSRAELLGQPVEMLVPQRFRGHHPGLREAFFADPRPRTNRH
jgi:two-component system, sensor histidine kinase PdtaS